MQSVWESTDFLNNAGTTLSIEYVIDYYGIFHAWCRQNDNFLCSIEGSETQPSTIVH